ncbi:MAG TPA: hypothetical protein VGO90_15685 [Chthoniobacteraceae bacterium]|jgi:hypothetical protein|nr:hypothetical protein [Chthoniobacteraceae bacterium]
MSKSFAATIFCSALGLIGAPGCAPAEPIGRYECSVIDTPSFVPIGDRNEHSLLLLQYSCFGVEGILKGYVHTASSVSELDGSKVTFLRGGGFHRSATGLAVTQITDDASAAVKDGKPGNADSSGTGSFKFASGTLAAHSGKTFKFVTRQKGLGRFDMEFTD